jgi:hypothetical protein
VALTQNTVAVDDHADRGELEDRGDSVQLGNVDAIIDIRLADSLLSVVFGVNVTEGDSASSLKANVTPVESLRELGGGLTRGNNGRASR